MRDAVVYTWQLFTAALQTPSTAECIQNEKPTVRNIVCEHRVYIELIQKQSGQKFELTDEGWEEEMIVRFLALKLGYVVDILCH